MIPNEGRQRVLRRLQFLTPGGFARQRKAAYEPLGRKQNSLPRDVMASPVHRRGTRTGVRPQDGWRGCHPHDELGSRKRIQLPTLSAGKTIPAKYDENRMREIIDRSGLEPPTGPLMTDEEELFSEPKRRRERWYTTKREEHQRDSRSGCSDYAQGQSRIDALSIS